MSAPASIGQRKIDHIELCERENVEARERTTLLEQVHLLHDSLPELALDEVDIQTRVAGHVLRAPLMISGMTGGVDEAGEINRQLAGVAERFGMAFGLGSQRPMLRDPEAAASYRIREHAPTVFLCGNIGAVQAAEMSSAQLRELVEAVDANALCIHLNPGQELIQNGGDRDFRGCLAGIRRAVEALPVPVIAKETGCGMSPTTLRRLRDAGVTTVDVSGAGGTTWVGVEALRNPGLREVIGQQLWDWGVPTAAAVVFAKRAGMSTIASGGIRTGVDAARALALGASVASAALPFLRAVRAGGPDAAAAVAEEYLETLRTVMLLTGSRTLDDLRKAPRVLGPELQRWLGAE